LYLLKGSKAHLLESISIHTNLVEPFNIKWLLFLVLSVKQIIGIKSIPYIYSAQDSPKLVNRDRK